MPSALRRSRRRELVLTSSFTRAIQDKVRPETPHADGRDCRAFFADRTNARLHTSPASTFEASNRPTLTSRPSMILSLYHSASPGLPVHPIHRLPPELLVHVFALASIDDMMFPVLVSHVCHAWRAMALHAHSLWRRVLLSPDSNACMWKERIYRARQCTLDAALTSSLRSKASYDIDIVALQMHLLIPHFPVLRSLEIQFDSYAPYLWNAALGPLCRSNPYLWDHRYSNTAVEIPKLQSLTLRYPRNDDAKEFSLFGGSAPRLARVTLEGVRLTWHPDLFGNISFLDYTHHGFNRGEDAVGEILSMLQISSRIRQLKLRISPKVLSFHILHLRRPLIGDDDVVLPCLESLSLCVDSGDLDIPSEFNAILSRLYIPKLEMLYLQDLWTATSGYPSLHFRPFSALPQFMDTICHNVSPSSLMAEGRWIEPSLLSRLQTRLPSLMSIQVGNMTASPGVRDT